MLAIGFSRAAGTYQIAFRALLRNGEWALKMSLPNLARTDLATAREALAQFPDPVLAAKIADVEARAAKTKGRPEDWVYAKPKP